ncbi:MAG: hypothetical protein LBF15_02665 [Candidatus Peribacteria bacterium]|nr:hypothetical protein [Candidatus Peribacteria bacterium]
MFPFDDYIYSDDVNLTVDRLKNLGFKHLLVDLNSATIDNSLTHDLTTRYEHLLETFLSPRLRLVSTDSICLQLALDLYKMNGDMSQYMTVAGPNYESYDEDGTQILRIQKKVACLNYMSDLLNSGEVDDQNYPYLIPYKNYFESTAKEINVNELNRVVGNSYRVLFEIK